MSRIARAVSAAEEDAMEEPAAYALVGRWRLDSMELFRWAPDSTAKAKQAFRDARQTAARTVTDIRAGSLIIETVFEPTLRYTHTLRRGDRTVYSEAGAWAVPGLTGRVQVMTDTGEDGTYHQTRIVARDGGMLVLERHFTSGGSRGTGERVFLTRQPADGAAPGAAPHRD